MVVSWAGLVDSVKRHKLKMAFRDPRYFLEDKLFVGDMYEQPFPLTVWVMRNLYMPIHTVNGVPNQFLREIDLICGMRSGKTATCGFSSAYTMFRIHRICALREGWSLANQFKLLKTQKFVIGNVAVNEDQSIETIFDVTKGVIEESPYFQELAGDKSINTFKNRIEFPNEYTTIRAMGSNSASNAGRTSPLFSADEVDQFDDTEGPQGITAVYSLGRNATKTLFTASHGLFGKVVIITSSGAPGSFSWRLKEQVARSGGLRKHLVVPTWYDPVHNPLGNRLYMGIESMHEEYNADPGAFWQLYGCNPHFTGLVYIRDYDNIVAPCYDNSIPDLLNPIWDGIRKLKARPEFQDIKTPVDGTLLDVQLRYLMRHIKEEVEPLPYLANTKYCMSGDPSKSGDAFGIALGHIDPSIAPTVSKVYQYNSKGILQKEEPKAQQFSHVVYDGLFRFVPRSMEIPVLDVEAMFLCTHKLIPYSVAGFDIWQYPHIFASLRARGVKTFTRRVLFPEYEQFKTGLQNRSTRMPYFRPIELELRNLQRITTATLVRIDHPKGGSKDVADAAVLVRVGLDHRPANPSSPRALTLEGITTSHRKRSMISSQQSAARRFIGIVGAQSNNRR